jgi:intein/homing endonuclease
MSTRLPEGEVSILDELPENAGATRFGKIEELGATGLKRATGVIDEEFLPALRGRKAIEIFREMSFNDPMVGALLFTIDKLLRGIEWEVQPCDQTPESAQAGEFLESCMDDMCYDDQTEVLTDTGWKLFSHLTDDDLVAQRDSDGTMSYVQPRQRHVYDYEGPLYTLDGKSINLAVSPNHRLLMARRTGRQHDTRQKHDLGIIRAKDAYRKKGWMSKEVRWSGALTGYGHDYLELLGMLTADGCFSDRNVVLIQKDREYVEALLKRNMITARTREVNGSTQWIIGGAAWAQELAEDFGRVQTERRIPAWLANATPSEMNAFLDGYIQGDGWHSKDGRISISTSSIQMADDLQVLAMKAGRAATVLAYVQSSGFAPGSDIYQVSIWSERKDALYPYVRYENWGRKDYSGKIYCVSVPSGVVMVRRHGIAVWSGNSESWDDFISEVLSMLTYGFSYHEIVYKRRIGPWEKNPSRHSKYDDGLYGWRKIPVRSQETLLRWVFDEKGGIRGFVQLAPPLYKTVFIPIEKSLLFRTGVHKGNPEGKAEDVGNIIWTPNGQRKFGELSVGDLVYGSDGQPTRVVATRRFQNRPRYLIEVDSGELGIYDANHLWPTLSNKQLSGDIPRTPLLRTEELLDELEKAPSNQRKKFRVAGPVSGIERDLVVDPWTLGYWLGNGGRGGAQMSCHVDDVPEIITRLEEVGYLASPRRVKDTNACVVNVRGLKVSLREVGVLNNKHVPEAYLSASVQQRRDLLAGLLDSDGYGDEFGRVEFSNTNKDLIDAVAVLVRSLGMKAHVTLRKEERWGTVITDHICQLKRVWNVKFTPHEQVFTLTRKGQHITSGHQRIGTHWITRIERVDDGPTMCIEVDSEDGIYLTGAQFVTTHNSILRNAYRPWWMKKRLEEFEAIGVERDLAGMPTMKLPSDYLSAKAGTEKHKAMQGYRKMVRGVRRDENEGLIYPSDIDPDTKQPYFMFELMNSGGTRQFDTNSIITRYEQRILMTVLADFILVGHQETGSYALHTDKTGIFRASLNSIADTIADVINRFAVPRLFALNAWKPRELPRFVPSQVDPPDLSELAQFISATAGAGMQWFPDPELEKFIRDAARLPKMTDETLEFKRMQVHQDQAMEYAGSQMEMLGMQQKAEMTAQGFTPEQAQMQSEQPTSDQQKQFAQAEMDGEQARAEHPFARKQLQEEQRTTDRDFAMDEAAKENDAVRQERAKDLDMARERLRGDTDEKRAERGKAKDFGRTTKLERMKQAATRANNNPPPFKKKNPLPKRKP